MSNAGKDIENPFPAKAVTTFGVRLEVVAKFAYMPKAREHVINYLVQYPKGGGALALSGGHGSGKTFLLNWLSNEISAITSARSQTVYAKADSDSVIDIYRQFLRSITRSTLIEVTRTAIRNIGGNIAGAAQATRKTRDKIQSSGTVQPALDEKIFDTNELYLLLKTGLERIGVSPAVSGQVAYAIGILEHPEFGEAAFSWLNGGNSQLLRETPLQSPLWSNESADAADIAASALECVAGLYRLAEISLILILDQMENFIPGANLMPTDTSLLKKLVEQVSLLKKLVEQVSDQGALLLMAGTPVAWERLPRDVGPRLINRGAPILIGGLNLQETTLLLNAYLRGGIGFAPEAVATIRDLSGGNSREILQIAYEVFVETGGKLSTINDDLLIQAAQKSGTLADRATLAIQMIDTAAERLNLSHTAASTSDGQKIDRMLVGPQGLCLAVVLLTSPDARTEAEDARKLTALRKQLELEPNQPRLLTVAVGFSSARVRAIVGEISRVLEFDENTFQELVEREFQRLSTPIVRESSKETTDLEPLLQHLMKLDERLARIEANRTENERETTQTLQRGAAKFAESERAETEAKTRHELRFGLDELHEALTERDSYLERRILRRLLVANEANVKDQTFDYLGSVYLDALDGLQLIGSPRDYENNLAEQYSLLRSNLIRTMRSKLSSRRNRLFDLRSPLFKSFPIGIIAGVYAAVPLFMYFVGRTMTSYEAITLSLLAGIIATGASFVVFESFARPERRYRAFAARLDELRNLERKMKLAMPP